MLRKYIVPLFVFLGLFGHSGELLGLLEQIRINNQTRYPIENIVIEYSEAKFLKNNEMDWAVLPKKRYEMPSRVPKYFYLQDKLIFKNRGATVSEQFRADGTEMISFKWNKAQISFPGTNNIDDVQPANMEGINFLHLKTSIETDTYVILLEEQKAAPRMATVGSK